MSALMELPRERIEQFCRKWKVAELSLFGSILRNDLKPDSDVDILVSFDPTADLSIFDFLEMEQELSNILGREVDLVTRRAVENSHNWIRKKAILQSARKIYVSG